VNTVIHVVFALLIGYILFRMVDVIVEFLRQVAVKSGSTLNDMLVPIVSTSLRLTVIVLVVLEIMTAVSDQPPSTVIAGLGAGGLAIGLAAQDTIKNFFGSVMIYADRPFELGDRIVIDGHDGPVEAVGFRSTRIRTLDGHLVTVPNGEMAYKTIHNIGKRPYIRRIMNIRVAYDTPPEKVRKALAILREVLANHEGMEENLPAARVSARFPGDGDQHPRDLLVPPARLLGLSAISASGSTWKSSRNSAPQESASPCPHSGCSWEWFRGAHRGV
jgi:MscS family membrane protein